MSRTRTCTTSAPGATLYRKTPIRAGVLKQYLATPIGAPKPKLPFGVSQLLQLRLMLQFHLLEHRCFWACVLFQVHTLARTETIAFNVLYHDKLLLYKHVWSTTSNGIAVLLRNWKHHAGEETVIVLQPTTSMPALCVVQAFREYHCAQQWSHEEEPYFHVGHVPLWYRFYAAMLARFTAAAGLNPAHYTSTSLRRAGIAIYEAAGLTLQAITMIGRWAKRTMGRPPPRLLWFVRE